MSSKSWRLVVTEIGGSAPVSEARVEAGNWMTALTLARKSIGESGGVPPGASCSVSPDGRVTIQDAIARKTYSLAPDVTTSLSERPPPKGPRVPSESVPRAAVHIPKPSDRPPAKSRPPQKTISYEAGALGVPAPERPKRTPQKTISYSIGELARAATTNAAQEPAKPAEPASEAPKAEPRKRAPQRTIAYDAAQLGVGAAPQPVPEQPPQRPEADSTAKPKRASRHTIAYDAAQLGVATDAAEAPPAWDLLHARDEDPSKDSPLLYRERTYVVLQQTSAALAEAILRARFDELRDELADRPKGKLVNMALFDHRWTERPAKPPLATLQWKDWRGEPVVAAASAPRTADASPAGAQGTESSPPRAVQASAPAAAAQPAPARANPSNPPPADQPAPAIPSSPPQPAQAEQPAQATPSSPPQPAQAEQTAQATPSSPPQPADASPTQAEQPAPATAASPTQPADASPTQAEQPAPATAASPPQAEQPAPATAASPTQAEDDASAPQPSAGGDPPEAPERVEEPALAHEPTAPATPVASLREATNALAHDPTVPATPVASLREARDPEPALAHEPTVPAAPAMSPPPADELDLPIADVAPARVQSGPDDRLATAFEALQDLFFLTTPLEGLDFVVRLLGDLVPSRAASACLYDINTDEFRFVALTGPGAAERKGEAVPRLAGLFGAAALAGGEALLIEGAGQDERFDPGIDGRVGVDPDTMALVAVAHGGRLLGLLQLINRVDQAQFSRADANLLTYVAEKLGEFLHAARMRPAD